MQFLKASTEVIVRIGPFVDKTDAVTPETGITLGAADQAELLKETGAVVDISGATWAGIANCGGWYDLTLTTAHTNTVGRMDVIIQDASECLPVFARFEVIPVMVYNSLIAGSDTLEVDAIAILGSSLDSNAATLKLKSLDIQNSAGTAIIAKSTGSNGLGMDIAGNGSGKGAVLTGGATGAALGLVGGGTSGEALLASTTSGSAIKATAGGGNKHGLELLGQGDGCGLSTTGGNASGTPGGKGAGIKSLGGTVGDGMYVGATQGCGLEIYGAGTTYAWHGLYVEGGGVAGDGIKAASVGAGHGIEAVGHTNKSGVMAQGNGTAAGLTGIGGATGNGITGQGGATSGTGILGQTVAGTDQAGIKGISTATSGNGLWVQGNGGNHGVFASGGTGSGSGIQASAGDAATSETAGIRAGGGVNATGFMAIGGSTSGAGATFTSPLSGDGIVAIGVGAGKYDINADIQGSITSVGNVTGTMSGNHTGNTTGTTTGAITGFANNVGISSISGATVSAAAGENFNTFFYNGGNLTGEIVDNVGSGGASAADVWAYATRTTTGGAIDSVGNVTGTMSGNHTGLTTGNITGNLTTTVDANIITVDDVALGANFGYNINQIFQNAGVNTTGTIDTIGGVSALWGTALPGAYAAGTAGAILGGLSPLIPSGLNAITITVTAATVPIPGFAIQVFDETGTNLYKSGTSDISGEVTFGGLAAGDYLCRGQLVNYNFADQVITVPDGGGAIAVTATLTAALPTPSDPSLCSLYGWLTDLGFTAAGKTGVKVRIYNIDTDASVTTGRIAKNTPAVATTNSSGYFSIDLLKNIRIRIECDAVGYSRTTELTTAAVDWKDIVSS